MTKSNSINEEKKEQSQKNNVKKRNRNRNIKTIDQLIIITRS